MNFKLLHTYKSNFEILPAQNNSQDVFPKCARFKRTHIVIVSQTTCITQKYTYIVSRPHR